MTRDKIYKITIDDFNTKVVFKLRTTILTIIEGTLSNLKGQLNWDFENEKENKIEVSANASSVTTSLTERDMMFKDSQHLNVFNFSSVKLVAEDFIRKMNKVVGMAAVTIKEVTKEVKIKVTENIAASELLAELSFNRFDFNLGIPSDYYQDDIKVQLTIKTV